MSDSGVGAMGDPGGAPLDRADELGEVVVADDPLELLLGDQHSGRGPALAERDRRCAGDGCRGPRVRGRPPLDTLGRRLRDVRNVL